MFNISEIQTAYSFLNIIVLFQVQQFSPVFPDTNVALLLEAEEVLSKLKIPCLGKSFCEIGLNFNMNLDDEISAAVQESIR